MAGDDLIVGLDIGTTKVCAIIGEMGQNGELTITGVGSAPSRGMRKGVVVNIDSTVKSISSAIEEAEMMSGRAVQGVYAGIAGGHIQAVNSRGVVAVTGKNHEIGKEDIDRVVDAARAIVIPMEREIIHTIPQEFIVDDQSGIRDPQGMIGVRLEAEVHIITGAVSSAQNIVRCVNNAGFKVNDIVLEPIASTLSVLTDEEKELGVLLIDMGGGTTDMLAHSKGVPKHTEVLPLGGDQVTSDLSIMLRTPNQVAEQVKREAGCCYLGALDDPDAQVSFRSVGGREKTKTISQVELTEIINARMKEILTRAKLQIENAGYLISMRGGVVLTGGGALMPGTADLASEIFELPARVGYPNAFSGLVEEVSSPIYATGVGLVQYGSSRHNAERYNINSTETEFTNVWDRMKDWFKEFF